MSWILQRSQRGPLWSCSAARFCRSCDTVSKLTNSSAVMARPQEGNRACFMSDLHILSASPHLASVNAHEKARARRPQINRLEWKTRETRRTNKEPKQTCSCRKVVEKQQVVWLGHVPDVQSISKTPGDEWASSHHKCEVTRKLTHVLRYRLGWRIGRLPSLPVQSLLFDWSLIGSLITILLDFVSCAKVKESKVIILLIVLFCFKRRAILFCITTGYLYTT